LPIATRSTFVVHVPMVVRSKGAMSGLVLEQEGWLVWTVANHLVTCIQAFTEETAAVAAAGLPGKRA